MLVGNFFIYKSLIVYNAGDILSSFFYQL